MQTALFAGSFNPPTLGHLDIIERAAKLFKKLYVGIAENTRKEGLFFTTLEKTEMLQLITQHLSHVEIIPFTGLAADFAKQNRVDCLVRAVRSVSDFEYEMEMAAANRHLSGLETLFIPADAKHIQISSSLVREIIVFGGNLKGFVPEQLHAYIQKKEKSRSKPN